MNLRDTLPLTFNKMLRDFGIKPRNLNREAGMNVTLTLEKLSGKLILKRDNDLILRNLVRTFYALFANYETFSAPSITITDESGTGRTGALQRASATAYARQGLDWINRGDINVDTDGILIGIGTTAPARTDYNLQSKIPKGSGAGQITYQRMTYELLSDYQFRLTREFTNAGSNLAVTEAGLMYAVPIAAATYTTLLLHDVFSAYNVTAGNGIRVKYTFNF